MLLPRIALTLCGCTLVVAIGCSDPTPVRPEISRDTVSILVEGTNPVAAAMSVTFLSVFRVRDQSRVPMAGVHVRWVLMPVCSSSPCAAAATISSEIATSASDGTVRVSVTTGREPGVVRLAPIPTGPPDRIVKTDTLFINVFAPGR